MQSNELELVRSLVAKYLDRYKDIGYKENTLYPQIPNILEELKDKYRLAVCTYKREDFAQKVLSMFGLLSMFVFVNGADIGIDKRQQIQTLLNNQVISSNTSMIDDGHADLIVAHTNAIYATGVL